MLRSLRFRLPAIFLLGVLVAALVTAAIAVRFFQEDTRSRTLSELERQAQGLAELYTRQARTGVDQGRRAPRFAPPLLEQATGSELYYSGVEIFPGQASGLQKLPLGLLDEFLGLAAGHRREVIDVALAVAAEAHLIAALHLFPEDVTR